MAAKRSQVSIDRIVEEYRRIAFANTTDGIQVRGGWVQITDTDDLTPEQQAAISEIHQTKDGVRIKFHDKTKALDSLGEAPWHVPRQKCRWSIRWRSAPDVCSVPK